MNSLAQKPFSYETEITSLLLVLVWNVTDTFLSLEKLLKFKPNTNICKLNYVLFEREMKILMSGVS